MSDFNAKIVAIDSAMDAVELYQRELSDLRAHINFDMRSLSQKLEREIQHAKNEIEQLQEQIDRAHASDETDFPEETGYRGGDDLEELYSKLWSRQAVLQDLEQLMIRCSDYGSELLNQFLAVCGACSTEAEEAIHFMGRYIHDLNLICNHAADRFAAYRSAAGYYVCVVDSARYPATAEHIRVVQDIGHLERMTIDRPGAPRRRADSLQNTPVRSEFDRDEYPMAMFREGGSGADVAYLEGPDNRGAGAYISWQLRGVPDGAEVRIRII